MKLARHSETSPLYLFSTAIEQFPSSLSKMTTSTVNECQSSTLLTAENYKFSLMDLACNYVASIHGAAVLVIQDLKEKGLESKDFNTRIVSLPRFEYKKSVFLIDSH